MTIIKENDVEERLRDYQALKYNKNNKFDIDLEFGENFEKSVAKILTLGKVEIKTEMPGHSKYIGEYTPIITDYIGLEQGIKETYKKILNEEY